jgi:hypothetical protein
MNAIALFSGRDGERYRVESATKNLEQGNRKAVLARAQGLAPSEARINSGLFSQKF